MKFSYLACICLCFSICYARNDRTYLTLNNSTRDANSNIIDKLYYNYPHDRLVQYFHAAKHLQYNQLDDALKFIIHNDYFSIDIKHQLLTYYFNNKEFNKFIDLFKTLPERQMLANEKCGYEVAMLNTQHEVKYNDLKTIIRNNPPPWCANLALLKFNAHDIELDDIKLMLFNLAINRKFDVAMQVMISLNNSEINKEYDAINDIIFLANTNVKSAYNSYQKLNGLSKNFAHNYIAMKLAAGYEFDTAILMFSTAESNIFSDNEYEWRNRAYLAHGMWQQLISSINAMPEYLRHRNTWLYWLAKAYDGVGEAKLAETYLERIPNDYSYYSLLANIELNRPTNFMSPVKITTTSHSNANDIIDIWLAASRLHLHDMLTLATKAWYYLMQTQPDRVTEFSVLAKTRGAYMLSIYSANLARSHYINLSFPLVFDNLFTRYSKEFNVDKAYLLAIARQESKFSSTVIAEDGGVGIMQIMPRTGADIANQLHSANCIYNVACNIRFASWHLSSVLHSLGNDMIYGAAAYNRGLKRAKTWQGVCKNMDKRIQIEIIPFDITRKYIQNILINRAIYNEVLTRRLSNQGFSGVINPFRNK